MSVVRKCAKARCAMTRLLMWGAVVGLLAACQPTLQADVTRFYSLPPVPAGKSFAISPESGQATDLEFQHYAAQVSGAMQSKGFRLATPGPEQSDLVAVLHYGTNGSRTEIYSDPAPAWGHPGWRGWYGGFPPPQINSYTLYSEFLDVALFDGAAWRTGERRPLFQGRVVADSGVRDLNVAMPYLIQALFQDFPGVNGQTVRVTVPLQ
ncbi:DUF4136 domain-containing protein [Telmatospirillum sp.]|uniref:DUF4136 domain-containing protein n=1 Tax=Telmatospirillum sp. TaxID=2079197 RepID=UPI00284A9F7C|nr:DUF4136 domain-containing protein [Telmatospirillum sp.]MDR3439190.1 DUF4136 domain-containing protein [Telmatospirillum sp.]